MKFTAIAGGLGSNWFYYSPDRLLFDCGEAVGVHLRKKIFAIKKILITHRHSDHVSGLWRLVHQRGSLHGDRAKPLEVYYPSGDKNIEAYLEFVNTVETKLPFKLSVIPITEDADIPLGKNRFVRTFKTNHNVPLTLGYTVIEKARKLKNEYRSLPHKEIESMRAKLPEDSLFYSVEKKLFCYPGDTGAVDPELFRDAEILVHEATILNPEDADHLYHSNLDQAISIAKEAGVKRLIINHISPRYDDENEIMKIFTEKTKHCDFKVDIILPYKTFSE